MAKSTAKTKRTTGAKSKKKKADDYGTSPAKRTSFPKGFSMAKKPSGFFKFTQIGHRLEGVYRGTKESKKKGYSDSIQIETVDGIVLTPESADLKEQVEMNKIKDGDKVIFVLADVTSIAGNRTYKRFDVGIMKGKK